jgi:hypothetical protein
MYASAQTRELGQMTLPLVLPGSLNACYITFHPFLQIFSDEQKAPSQLLLGLFFH